MIQLKALLGNYIFHFEFVTLTSTVGHEWKVLISEDLLHDVMRCLPPRRIHVNCHTVLPNSWAVCSNENLIADSWFKDTLHNGFKNFQRYISPTRAGYELMSDPCKWEKGRSSSSAELCSLHGFCVRLKRGSICISPPFSQLIAWTRAKCLPLC